MRAFFRRSGRDEGTPRGPATCYRSSSYVPLAPWQVRERRFRPTRIGRRGLDPGEVQEFLDRVADDLSAVYRALGDSRQGAVRLARVVARWASLLSPADPGETTVSAEDEQGVRHRVFCDLLLPGGRRCLLRADHDGPCARRLTR